MPRRIGLWIGSVQRSPTRPMDPSDVEPTRAWSAWYVSDTPLVQCMTFANDESIVPEKVDTLLTDISG